MLRPDQFEKLIRWVDANRPDMLAYFVIGTFCGVRPSELRRLRWMDVDLRIREFRRFGPAGMITVGASASKVRHRRVVPIHPVAIEWLKRCPPMGMVINHESCRRHMAKFSKPIGLEWSNDLLRHTAASYLLARFDDEASVARWLGHSPQTLYKHYFQLVCPEDCEAFWSIKP